MVFVRLIDVVGSVGVVRVALVLLLVCCSVLGVYCIMVMGYVYLDMVWFWLVSEACRKVLRMFVNVVDLFERYFDYYVIVS